MKWLRATLDSAGFGQRSLTLAVTALLTVGVSIGAITFELTQILALSLSLSLGAMGFMLESLKSRAKSRRANLEALWPEVVDSLITAIASGSSITESILDLSETGPAPIRQDFRTFRDDIETGYALAVSLQNLKVRFGDVHSDRLFELLILVSDAGGEGLLDGLRNQVRITRQELGFNGEIASRLGWITGTAKIAVGAPWVIVALLATRPENASAYASPGGSLILLLGLALSVFAYRLVQALGAMPSSPRVFA